MELASSDTDADDMHRPPPPSPSPPPPPSSNHRSQFPIRTHAYHFDGLGSYHTKDWDLSQPSENRPQFDWYHVELPKSKQKLSASAQSLISVLCPPLKLQDILTLASNGPFCGNVNGALIFRVNSSGPSMSEFTLRIAARVTEDSVITVSLGRVPRLGFSKMGQSLLSEIPSVENERTSFVGDEEGGGSRGVVIGQNLLESLLTMNHSEEADNPVPRRVSDLLLHIVDTHVDQVQDIVTRLEMDLDSVELELDRAGSSLKKHMLDDRRFPKMHLNLQRLLQVVAHGEQVFPRVKEKCAAKNWFLSEDIVSFEELIGRLRRLKENLGFLVNRVTAVQAGLDSWQAEQINRKLYYLSFLSMIFLPLSIVTGVFGMNVGGVPWTGQHGPGREDGFLNVMLICTVILFLLLLCFAFPSLYSRVSAWRRRRAFTRSFSLNRKSFRRFQRNGFQGGYTRI